MELRSFTSDRKLEDSFLRFPYDLYKDDRNFIPPIERTQRQLLDSGSAAHIDSGMVCRHFLAYSSGEICGRISAFFNPQLRASDNQPVGAVGLFECRNDYRAAELLLRNACLWLKNQFGLTRVWGPLNGSIWNGYRFMTRGFDSTLFVGEPYNPPYYPLFFERFGFHLLQEWDSLFVSGKERLEALLPRGAERLELLKGKGYRFENFKLSMRREQIETLRKVLISSYRGFIGFTSVSSAQFLTVFERMEPLLDPELFLLVYNPNNLPVGFAVAFPDYPDAIRAMKGKSGLTAKLAYLFHRERQPRLNFYIGGVTPETEKEALGLGRAGFYFIIRKALDKGYDEIMLTLRVKGNKAHGLAGRCGITAQHEYALYEFNYEN